MGMCSMDQGDDDGGEEHVEGQGEEEGPRKRPDVEREERRHLARQPTTHHS